MEGGREGRRGQHVHVLHLPQLPLPLVFLQVFRLKKYLSSIYLELELGAFLQLLAKCDLYPHTRVFCRCERTAIGSV